MLLEHKNIFAMSICTELHWVTKWQEVQGAVWVLQGVGGCLALQRQWRSQAPNTEAKQRGAPCPQLVFHLLCFHTELPSSRLWELALRASSDPSRSAFVTAHPPLSSSFCSVSVSFLFFPSFCLLFVQSVCFCCIFVLFSAFAGVLREN